MTTLTDTPEFAAIQARYERTKAKTEAMGELPCEPCGKPSVTTDDGGTPLCKACERSTHLWEDTLLWFGLRGLFGTIVYIQQERFFADGERDTRWVRANRKQRERLLERWTAQANFFEGKVLELQDRLAKARVGQRAT